MRALIKAAREKWKTLAAWNGLRGLLEQLLRLGAQLVDRAVVGECGSQEQSQGGHSGQ